ncbi:MAG: MFS transporter [Bacteroidota bacterium]
MSVKHDPFAAMRSREFRFFIWAKFLLTVALQMQAVIISWLIYDITKDTLALGLIGLTEAVPALALALPGGIVADRYNRRKILIISTGIMMLASVALAFYAYGYGTHALWPAYVVIFIIGAARGFFNPSQGPFWSQLIDREHYVNASVWNSSMWQTGAVSGPALGGICYAWLGAGVSSIIVCVLILITMLYYVFIGNKPVVMSNRGEAIKDSLKAGLAYVWNSKTLLSAIALDMFAVLFGGAVALLPAFADQILHTGPQGLGFLRAAPALGSVIMAGFLAFYPPHKDAGKKMLLCVGGFGICMIAFALSENFYLSFFILMLSGVFDNVSVVIRSTIMQTFTPDAMRGRVAAVNSIFVGSSNEIGAFESGLAARLLGLVNSVVAGGCITLMVTVVGWKKSPSLRKLEL